ncbi:MAG: hypothetical protein KGK07_06730 [Chloroflexota bacterium]|nr:hypothetical protein [Chloroflexota bacterium]
MTPVRRRQPPADAAPIENFYRAAVEDAAALAEAAEVTGIDGELALLRAKLRAHLKERPQDYELLLKGVRLIAQIVAAQYRMSPARTDELAGTLADTVRLVGGQFFPERFGDV